MVYCFGLIGELDSNGFCGEVDYGYGYWNYLNFDFELVLGLG